MDPSAVADEQRSDRSGSARPDHPSSGRGVVDAIVVRAVRRGMFPDDEDGAPTGLIELAGGDRRLLEVARRRLEFGLMRRPSRAGERARDAVCDALALLALEPVLASGATGAALARR